MRPAYQAYWILYVGFAALPILAGLDKFFHLLADWDMYLAEQGTSQPEEVVRLPKLSNTAPLPPLKHLVRGPAVEQLHVTSVKHDHLMGTAGESQRGGTPRNARA